jgi:hypothetical protein
MLGGSLLLDSGSGKVLFHHALLSGFGWPTLRPGSAAAPTRRAATRLETDNVDDVTIISDKMTCDSKDSIRKDESESKSCHSVHEDRLQEAMQFGASMFALYLNMCDSGSESDDSDHDASRDAATDDASTSSSDNIQTMYVHRHDTLVMWIAHRTLRVICVLVWKCMQSSDLHLDIDIGVDVDVDVHVSQHPNDAMLGQLGSLGTDIIQCYSNIHSKKSTKKTARRILKCIRRWAHYRILESIKVCVALSVHVCVYTGVCGCMCACVRVCVCKRERESSRERERVQRRDRVCV